MLLEGAIGCLERRIATLILEVLGREQCIRGGAEVAHSWNRRVGAIGLADEVTDGHPLGPDFLATRVPPPFGELGVPLGLKIDRITQGGIDLEPGDGYALRERIGQLHLLICCRAYPGGEAPGEPKDLGLDIPDDLSELCEPEARLRACTGERLGGGGVREEDLQVLEAAAHLHLKRRGVLDLQSITDRLNVAVEPGPVDARVSADAPERPRERPQRAKISCLVEKLGGEREVVHILDIVPFCAPGDEARLLEAPLQLQELDQLELDRAGVGERRDDNRSAEQVDGQGDLRCVGQRGRECEDAGRGGGQLDGLGVGIPSRNEVLPRLFHMEQCGVQGFLLGGREGRVESELQGREARVV